jgi:hypothetical protein
MNKIATLAKIANRLDSLGLTKEADILDAFIKKLAEDGIPAKPEGTSAPVSIPSTTYDANLGQALQVKIKSPTVTTAPTAPLDPAAFAKAAYKLVMGKWLNSFTNILNMLLKQDPETKFVVTKLSFTVNKNGSVDPASVIVTLDHDIKRTWSGEGTSGSSMLSADLKKEVQKWTFPQCTEAFEYEHPHALESGKHFGVISQ